MEFDRRFCIVWPDLECGLRPGVLASFTAENGAAYLGKAIGVRLIAGPVGFRTVDDLTLTVSSIPELGGAVLLLGAGGLLALKRLNR